MSHDLAAPYLDAFSQGFQSAATTTSQERGISDNVDHNTEDRRQPPAERLSHVLEAIARPKATIREQQGVPGPREPRREHLDLLPPPNESDHLQLQ